MIRKEPARPLYETIRRWVSRMHRRWLTLPALVGAAAALTLALWAIWLVVR